MIDAEMYLARITRLPVVEVADTEKSATNDSLESCIIGELCLLHLSRKK